MNAFDKTELDKIDRNILSALSKNSRASLKELGEIIGLSSPSLAERIRKLSDQGVINAFIIDIDPQHLGFPLQAIVRIRPLPGKVKAVEKQIVNTKEIIECDKVTGDDCYIARICVRSMQDIDRVIGSIGNNASTSTSMVKGNIIQRRLPPLFDK